MDGVDGPRGVASPGTDRRRTDRPPHRWAVFVDAGYLYGAGGALVHGVSSRRELRADGPALVAALMERAAATMPGERLRLYWFDAARDRVHTVEQRELARLPYVEVRLGNLTRAGVQKGVDAQVRSDLVALAASRAVTDAVLLIGDEDMVPAVEEVQAHGVLVHLWGIEPPYGSNQAEHLVWEADTVDTLDRAAVEPYIALAPPVVRVGAVSLPAPARPSPATIGIAPRRPPLIDALPTGPDHHVIVEVGEHIASRWLVTRGRENVSDLLPGPILPASIDKELLVEAEKELGTSLRSSVEARTWVRDGFWSRLTRELGSTSTPG